MIRNLFIIFLAHFVTISSGASSCDPDEVIKKKITDLKVEVACGAADSLHDCQKFLNVPETINLQSSAEEMCEEKDLPGYPVSLASRVLAKQVNAAIVSHDGRLVTSTEEFFEHTRLHRERVKALGLELYKSHPELFRGLNKTQVASVLESHDMAKMRADSLSPDGKPFYRTLFEQGYGKKLDRSIVDALNAEDKKFMDNAQKQNFINTPELKREMERIEKIADFVDRGMSEVSPEEFGRKMDKASHFMQDAADKQLALELEKKYKTVTKGLSYRPLGTYQQKVVRYQLHLNERFVQASKSGDSAKISARLMSHKLLKSGTKTFASFLELLGSKAVSKAMMVLDFPMLYFASMDSIGCSGIGYHDWIKDPYCSPAIGLTPKVVDFLNEDWGQQKLHLKNENHTCHVIKETHKESMRAPKIISCSNTNLTMELEGGDRFQVKLDENKRMREINLMDLSNNAPGAGKPHLVKIGNNGRVSGYCSSLHREDKKCFGIEDKSIQKMNEFVMMINYQIQKGIACCLTSNKHTQITCN